MKRTILAKLVESLALLETLANKEDAERVSILNDLQTMLIKQIQSLTKKSPILKKREINLGEVKERLGVNFALERTPEETILASWIFNLQPKARFYLLSFFSIKESILPFFVQIPTEEEEAIINILAVLLLREAYQINSLENPLLSAIRSKIYSETIANISYLTWDNLLALLITKKIPFIEVFLKLKGMFRHKDQLNQRKSTLSKEFMNWVNENTYDELYAIFPVYINYKLIELIENLLELGYKKSSTSYLAHKLNVSQKTITHRFKALNESYTTYWLPEINFEKMNLHNYLLKITLKKDKYLMPLATKLLENPYLQNIYVGSDSNSSSIIYSPRLVCPHIISERLHEWLRKKTQEGIISDFCVNFIREKYRYHTLSERPVIPSEIKSFEKMAKKIEPSLKKFLFSHVNPRSQVTQKTKPMSFDYNLLYFLSIIKGKYLLRARYAVWINEFKGFYQKNNISTTDINAQIDLLYYYELQARKKGLIDFSLYLRSLMKRAPNVLIMEIPTSHGQSDEQLETVVDKLRIFSYLGEICLYDRYLFQILGISHKHPLRKSIEQFLVKNGFSPIFYTIKLQKSKFIPLHELYDYEEQKWKIDGISSF